MRTGISCVYQGLVESRAIYISDRESATNTPLIKELNITSIITAAKQVKLDYPCGNVKDYLFIAAEDKESYQIELHFDDVFEFIERVRHHGNILVHCAVGASRSVALVLAYFVRKHRYSVDHALALIRKKRPIANPNPGFMRALHSYGKKYCAPRIEKYRKIHKLDKMKRSILAFPQYSSVELPKTHQESSPEVQEALTSMMKAKSEVEERLQAVQKYYQVRCTTKWVNRRNQQSLRKQDSKLAVQPMVSKLKKGYSI